MTALDGDAIAERALACVGTRFGHQGRLPGGHLDCLGLVVVAIGSPAACVDQRDYATEPDGDRLCAALEEHFERLDVLTIDDAPVGSVLAFWLGRPKPSRVRHLGIRTGLGMVDARRQFGVVNRPIDDDLAERLWGAFRWRAQP